MSTAPSSSPSLLGGSRPRCFCSPRRAPKGWMKNTKGTPSYLYFKGSVFLREGQMKSEKTTHHTRKETSLDQAIKPFKKKTFMMFEVETPKKSTSQSEGLGACSCSWKVKSKKHACWKSRTRSFSLSTHHNRPWCKETKNNMNTHQIWPLFPFFYLYLDT